MEISDRPYVNEHNPQPELFPRVMVFPLLRLTALQNCLEHLVFNWLGLVIPSFTFMVDRILPEVGG